MNLIISEIKPGKCPECPHCRADANVDNFLKRREELREKVVQEAKDFFGSVNRDDTTLLIESTGELLLHENGCE